MTSILNNLLYGVSDAERYSLPFAMLGVLNEVQPKMTLSQQAQVSGLLGRPHADAADHFAALGAIFYWVLMQQPDATRQRDDYIEVLNWLEALRTGEVSLREQAWQQPAVEPSEIPFGLLRFVHLALGAERVCHIGDAQQQAEAQIQSAGVAIFFAEKVIKLAAERSSDAEAFYTNLADVVLKALAAAKPA